MPLSEGQIAPDFEFEDIDGEKKGLSELQTKKIVFFFPKANTRGCTQEACSFRDYYSDIQQLGVQVIGVSMDRDRDLEEFRKKNHLPYPLVSDQNGEIAKKYEVRKKFLWMEMADRVTFLLDEENKILKVFALGVTGRRARYGLNQHGKEVFEFLTSTKNSE